MDSDCRNPFFDKLASLFLHSFLYPSIIVTEITCQVPGPRDTAVNRRLC
jgi:hypothetical protein